MSGRFAPSPTGRLHLGNLRTALLAWAAATHDGIGFVVRMEDLDRVTSNREHERTQLDDLARLGLTWEPAVVRQSERFELYHEALASLTADGRTYECFCTRREIADAAQAPHLGATARRYPGTCRNLGARARAARQQSGRPPALRLRTDPSSGSIEFVDRVVGPTEGPADDVVLRRNDGVPAYHLAVVVDDHLQGVTQVVRGDDLLMVTPSQIALGRVLGFAIPEYAHVPMVVNASGVRLAKRDGAVTLPERLAALGSIEAVVGELAGSAGLTSGPVTATEVARRFSFEAIDRRTAAWTPLGDGRFELRPDSRRTA